jgi:hypothetical protein
MQATRSQLAVRAALLTNVIRRRLAALWMQSTMSFIPTVTPQSSLLRTYLACVMPLNILQA